MGGSDFERVFRALASEGTRYLVVGGVAVVLHGHPRMTADVDLFVDLERANVLSAMRALGSLGYRPRAPVPAESFADAETRKAWIADKGLTVFSLWSAQLPATEIDLFVEEPLPFAEAWARAVHLELDGTPVAVIGLADLIALKRAAGRAKDLEDVARLELVARIRSEAGDG